MTGILLAFEGIDGSGKSTQRNLLADALRRHDIPCVITAEPTQGKWGQKIREFSRTTRLTAQEELDLFILDRREHVETLIGPSLQAGKVVLTDRYYFSSAAYQGSLGLDPYQIVRQHQEFCPTPDLVVLIDLPPELGLQRVRARSSAPPDQFEVLASLRKCRDIFLALATDRFVVLDGTVGREELHAAVCAATARLGLWSVQRTGRRSTAQAGK